MLLLDEFPALGRLHFFEVSLAFLAGYGIKSFLIVQSLNQIEKAYGQNNAILDNCHVRVSFATNDKRTARRVCVADADDAFIQALKAGTEPARLVFQDRAGRAVELPVSLNGLTAAMNAAEQ